jgi:membrane protease YdiL (CAAX protease family)
MPGWRDVGTMLAFFAVTAVLVVGLAAIPPVHRALLAVPNQHFAAVPFGVRLSLVLTAGICEEAIFRGFLIEQLRDWTGSIGVAAWTSLVLFSLPHAWFYGFTLALLIPALLGGSLIWLYVLRRNLPVCMLMHAMVDGYSLLLVPAAMRAHGG